MGAATLRPVLRLGLLAAGLAQAATAEAGDPLPPPAEDAPHLVLRLPVADLPFNALGGFPSMQQSLHAVAGLGQLTHHSLFHFVARTVPLPAFWAHRLALLSVLAADVVFFTVPVIWQHEEWHRAVMSARGISSFNDVYNLQLLDGLIAVSHVADADLVRLKRDHPWDMIRLSSAGMEGELELARHFQRVAFAQRLDVAPDVLAAVGSTASVIAYRFHCASPRATQTTDASNAEDGADVAVRDFTGLDCDAWVYDLHRPDEPYEARGVHPSGVGLDRYIRYSDLTAAEQRVLRQVRNLGLLNLVTPYFLGISSFRLRSPLDGQPFLFNAALRHHLTTYGHELSLETYLGRDALTLLLSYRHGLNARGGFPALEAEVVRYPVQLAETKAHLSAVLTAWLQPEAQSFFADRATPGGRARLTLDVPMNRRVELSFELEAKTEGWVAGMVELEPALAFRGGLNLRL